MTKLKVGDTAGVGCMVDSCRSCEECEAGDEQYCSGGGMVGTYGAATTEERSPSSQEPNPNPNKTLTLTPALTPTLTRSATPAGSRTAATRRTSSSTRPSPSSSPQR